MEFQQIEVATFVLVPDQQSLINKFHIAKYETIGNNPMDVKEGALPNLSNYLGLQLFSCQTSPL